MSNTKGTHWVVFINLWIYIYVYVSPLRHTSGQAPPLRTSNSQVPLTEHSNRPNGWTQHPPYKRNSSSGLEIPPIPTLELPTLESSAPHPEMLHKSCFCSVLCCFSPEQKQPPSWGFPLTINLLCEICYIQCGFVVVLGSWLPGYRSLQSCNT